MIDLGEWILDNTHVEYVHNRPAGTYGIKLVQPGNFLTPLSLLEVGGLEEPAAVPIGSAGRLVFHDDGPLFEGSRVLWDYEGGHLVMLVDDAKDPDVHHVVVYSLSNANWNHVHGDGAYHVEWSGQGLQEVLDEYLGGARNG